MFVIRASAARGGDAAAEAEAAGGVVEQAGHTRVVPQQPAELGLKGLVGHRVPVSRVELVEGGNERLGDEASAVAAEVARRVRHQSGRRQERRFGPGHAGGHRTGLGVAGWLPAVTSSATASRGLFWVTSPSPTSTASAPAAA